MKEKFLLILMNEELILYKDLRKKVYVLKENIEEIRAELRNFFSSSPKIPLYLLIDPNPQELREEELPPLWLWDQLRLLYHKKQHWASHGKLYGYHFLKQDKKTYLQWISLAQNDPLIGWLSWIKSLPNPFLGVYFVPLEAGAFIQKHHTSPDDYGMLIYTLSSSKTRHAIFKGRRLLLSRSFSGEEDLKSSLHFLSRTSPDIHKKIQVFNLNHDISLKLTKEIKLVAPDSFIHFLTHQKPTTLSLKINTSIHGVWFERSVLTTFILSFFLTGLLIHQGIEYQIATRAEEAKIALLQIQLRGRALFLKNKDVRKQRAALVHYQRLRSPKKDLFFTLKKFSPLLGQYHVKLENFIWDDGQNFEIRFSLPNHKDKTLSSLFNSLLMSFHQVFPKSHVQVLEAPFKSSSHETYKHPTEHSHPIAHIRLELP